LGEEGGGDAGIRELGGVQGDGPADQRVPGLVDRAEAARGDLLEDLVLADLTARLARGLGRAGRFLGCLLRSEPAHPPPSSSPRATPPDEEQDSCREPDYSRGSPSSSPPKPRSRSACTFSFVLSTASPERSSTVYLAGGR